MALDTVQFRTDFPEFADYTVYPEGVVSFWLGIAAVSLSELRWGAWWTMGQELFIAHNLVLAAQSQEDSSLGVTPGEVQGAVTAKAVDKVSVSKDVTVVTLEDGGFWNMTRYGVQLLQFARMCGTGGIQFGGC